MLQKYFASLYKVSSIISPFNWYLLRKNWNTFLITVPLPRMMWPQSIPSSVTMIAVKRFGFALFQSSKRELKFKVLLKSSIFINSAPLSLAYSILYAIKVFHFKMIPLFSIIWIHRIHTYHRRVSPVSLVFSVYFVHKLYIFLWKK